MERAAFSFPPPFSPLLESADSWRPAFRRPLFMFRKQGPARIDSPFPVGL